MRTLATKQPSNQDSAHQKPVRATPVPVARSLSTDLTDSAILQRKPGCACGGGCPRCQEQALLQTKLKISEPGDQYEQEADRIADEVMQMPEPSIQRQMEPEEDEEEGMVQRQAIANQVAPLDQKQESPKAPPIVHEVLNSPGQLLDPETRNFMEPRFGYDFSHVRIHTNAKAAESARKVNALAYTVGHNIVFSIGQYKPEANTGKRLIAHELTHVMQQGDQPTTSSRNLIIGSTDSLFERQAEHIANRAISRKGHRTMVRWPLYSQRSPTRVASALSANILVRKLEYTEQVSKSECKPFLEKFDLALNEIEKVIQSVTTLEANDLLDAVANVRNLRSKDQVTCWHTARKIAYASYDSISNQLRLHIDFGQSTNPITLLHEAIHAIHAKRYPQLSQMYGESLKRGNSSDVVMLKWKAWTEYWAYRKAIEYDNLRQLSEFRRDPHQSAINEEAVIKSIRSIRTLADENFEPWKWTPPAKYKAKPTIHKPSRRP
jgi:Zn-dependent peptidase ImmA (M78 family)